MPAYNDPPTAAEQEDWGTSDSEPGIHIWRWVFVFEWLGWRRALRRYRWGLVGSQWPTLYLGAFKVMWGPAPTGDELKEAAWIRGASHEGKPVG